MLSALTIRNFVLIERLELRFEPGLCLLTGETGAGKSILVDALATALGGRVALDDIRHGEARASVEATFTRPAGRPWPDELQQLLDEEGITPELDGEITLCRELAARGSRCRLDGHHVPLATLRRAGRLLGDVVSQHEHQRLADPAYHLELLDRYGRHDGMRATVERAHAAVAAARSALAAHRDNARERARQQDFWRFQRAEIEAAHLHDPSELEHLDAERLTLVHAESLRAACQKAYDTLYGAEGGASAYDVVARAAQPLTSLRAHDDTLNRAAEEMGGIQSTLRDVATDLRRRLDRFEADPARLEAVEQRLRTLHELARKYGPDLAAVIGHGRDLQAKLQALDAAEDREKELAIDLEQANRAMDAACVQLTAARRLAAEALERAVEQELRDLDLGRARFAVSLTPHEVAPRRRVTGQEGVAFEVALNPGEPPRPLARTASGGEMARVMLALACVLAGVDALQTLVFDEVDTGIAGRAAQAVAEKLARLACTHQVLCITHLPAVAAMADQHIHLAKRVGAERTHIEARELDGPARVRELAVLASGQPAPAAIQHAEEMLARARSVKDRVREPSGVTPGRRRR